MDQFSIILQGTHGFQTRAFAKAATSPVCGGLGHKGKGIELPFLGTSGPLSDLLPHTPGKYQNRSCLASAPNEILPALKALLGSRYHGRCISKVWTQAGVSEEYVTLAKRFINGFLHEDRHYAPQFF